MPHVSRSRVVEAMLVLGYAALAGATRRFSVAAAMAVLVAGAALLLLAAASRPTGVPASSRAVLGWVAWAAIAAAVAIWSVLGLVGRGPAPATLSSLAARRLHAWPARAGAIAIWLVLGLVLARPPRTKRP